SKPLAPKPLVTNPLPSKALTPVIHSSLTNLTNNLSLQQWQFPATQLQFSLISCDQKNSSTLNPIAVNPRAVSISTIPHNLTSTSTTIRSNTS
ncbi:12318_t:CDS:2, partial [Racocetra persica]